MQQHNLWITAIHEGGHVMGCRALGVPVKSATVVPSGGNDGMSSMSARQDSIRIAPSCLGVASPTQLG